jgi:hypothetical protein
VNTKYSSRKVVTQKADAYMFLITFVLAALSTLRAVARTLPLGGVVRLDLPEFFQLNVFT